MFSTRYKSFPVASRLVTMKETQLYNNDPETKQQSMEWRHSGLPSPKKFRVQKSARKVVASFFFYQDGILLIGYLTKWQTINYEYYSSLLVQLTSILKENKSVRDKSFGLFLHESAPSDRALATQKKLAYLGFQRLDHPPYSPDLDPSAYHLFPGPKKQFKGRHFLSELKFIACRMPGWTGKIMIFFEWLARDRATGWEIYWSREEHVT